MSMHMIVYSIASIGMTVSSTATTFVDLKPGEISAKAAFEKLKGLGGDWVADIEVEGGHTTQAPAKIAYRVTAAGSAVVEELFKGTEHEMVTVYHLDGDDLLLTHYCAAGNQPRLKLDRPISTEEELVFAFDGGTNFDPKKGVHMHEAKFVMKPGEPVCSYWTAFKDGKADHTAKFVLKKP